VWAIFAAILPPAAGIVAVALVLTTAFWLLRAHLPSILLVFVLVLFVSILVTAPIPKLRPDRVAEKGDRLSEKWKESGQFNEDLPIVVHLVLDELMSVGAMADDLPGASATRQALLDFGEKHSFRTFGSVYSRSYYTAESIPHMMNAGYLGQTGLESIGDLRFDAKARKYNVVANEYFDDMARRGYRTAVFQAVYLNFCQNRSIDLCETFDSFDPGAKTIDSPSLRVALWRTIFRAYGPSYTSSFGETILARAYGLPAEKVDVTVALEGGRYDVQRFPEWFERFTRFTASVPRGTHVFGYFLVPHSPYLLQESCVLSGSTDGHGIANLPASQQEQRRLDFYTRYFAQVRCLANELDKFMAALERSENFRDAVIIIHGDHGSRISRGEYLDDLVGKRDFIDNYATFFAVRAPTVPTGLDCQFASLPEVFRRYVARDGRNTPVAKSPLPVSVVSLSGGGTRVEASMPRFGCATDPAMGLQ
jgi:hypothetical protein